MGTNKNIFTITIFLLLITAACKQEMTREDYLEEIESAETELEKDVNDPEVFKERALRGARAYKGYLDKYPEDTTQRLEYMSNAAQLYAHAEKYDTSLAIIDSVRTNYPASEEAANLLHFKAFYIYEEGQRNQQKAEETYLQFLEEYPSHELVPAVLFSLDNLGKSDQEMLDAIRNKNRPDQYP